jgi:hypothetical protein
VQVVPDSPVAPDRWRLARPDRSTADVPPGRTLNRGLCGPTGLRNVEPLTPESAVQAAARPRLRGRLHQIAFLVAVPAGVAVIIDAHPAAARTAAVIYACGLAGLYGISSSYHRLVRSPRARYWMSRLDHSMIYVFIAASVTPFGLVACGARGRSRCSPRCGPAPSEGYS